VVADSPAAKAGLKEGDIITRLNDEEITETRSLARLLQQYKVGEQVKVTYLRAGTSTDVTVTLKELK
jgi:putative serine protease PepD